MILPVTIITLLVSLTAYLSGAKKTMYASFGFLGYLAIFAALNPY